MHGRSPLPAIRAWWLAAALAFVQLTAHAQALPKTFPSTVTNGVYTYSAGTANAANAAQFTFSKYAANDGFKGPMTTSRVPVTMPSGRAATMEATSRMTAAGFAGPLARFAMKVATPIAVGSALYDLYRELGLLNNPALSFPDSNVPYTSQGGCAVGTSCNKFTFDEAINGWSWSMAAAGAAAMGLSWFSSQYSGVKSCDAGGCSFWLKGYPESENRYRYVVAAAKTFPGEGEIRDVLTEQQLADKIAAVSGWPSTSRVDEALKQAAQADVPLPLPAPTITPGTQQPAPMPDLAPSVVTGDRLISTEDIGGARKTIKERTITTTKDVEYIETDPAKPQTLTTRTSRTTTTDKQTITTWNPINPDGTLGQQSSIETTPLVRTNTETTGQDAKSPPAEPPKDPCDANPDRLGCMTAGTPAKQDELSKETKNVTVDPVTFAPGGACPAPLSFTAFARSYAFQYTPLCNQLAKVAPLFMALAAFVAAWILADSFKVS
jgi:hypothetical protein